MKITRLPALLGLLLSLCSTGVLAQTGVTPDSVLIGQSVVLSGPMAENGDYYTQGIQLYLEQVNAKGGVHGRKVRLQTLDDAYNPQKAGENTARLINQDKVFALFGYAGTGATLASLPLAEKAGVPFIAPYSGADVLRKKDSKVLFNIRASYGDEFFHMVEQLVTTGVRSIAIAYQDDGFGQSGMKAAQAALEHFKLKPVGIGAIDGKTYAAGEAVKAISKASPEAILMGTAGKASSNFIHDYLKTGQRPQFFGLSVMSATQLKNDIGADSTGVVIAQVVPSPWSSKYRIVKEYREALLKSKQPNAHHASLEGWIAADILVEGLRRAGKDLTREKFIAALETMKNVDLGDFNIDFGPGQHDGSKFVDLSIIRANGQFVQ